MKMKAWQKWSAMAVAVAALAGCSATGGSGNVLGSMGGSTGSNRVGAATDALKAVTVTEAELKSAAMQMRAAQDKQARVAPPSNRYAQRLNRLTRKHQKEDGLEFNYKVYLNPQVNANVTPDGSIRVYSGLMDMMTDQELLGVIGHEIGHVKHGHSMSRLRTAYLASASRKAAASTGGVGGALAASELGNLAEAVINAQYSQSNENEADDYGQDFLKRHGYQVGAMESALRKLDKMSGGKQASAVEAMLSTHPEPGRRADRLRARAARR